MRKEREREIDHTQITPQTQSPLTSHPLTSPFFELNKIQLRLRLWIAPRSHPSTLPVNPEPRSRLRLRRDRTPGSHRSHWDRTNHTEIASITPQDRTETTLRSFPIWCRRPPLILIYLSLSLPSSLNLTEFDEFFLLGFVSVFIYWEIVLYICLEAEKMWGTRRKYVFYIIFSNTTKH